MSAIEDEIEAAKREVERRHRAVEKAKKDFDYMLDAAKEAEGELRTAEFELRRVKKELLALEERRGGRATTGEGRCHGRERDGC